ncbi:MAG: transglycosylase domain-containing protein [Mobilitalea sp.]
MDFSKKGIEHKQQYIRSTSRRLVSKTRITLFRLCIAAFVSLVIIGVFAGFGYVKGVIDSAPEITAIDVVPQGFTTTIYDKEGNIIEYLVGAQSNREYVSIDDFPDYIKYAFISIEDERFYEHAGIDVKGIFRAFVVGLKSGGFSEGGSTLTQQLLKNQVFNGGRESAFIDKLERKIQEQYLAIQLENQLDKDTILEYYLNVINLSSGTYGIQKAANRYFNKDAKDLSVSEAATIAAIAQNPVNRNPINYPENNEVRKNQILDDMLEQKHISQEEHDIAIADDVYSRIKAVNSEKDTDTNYTYFVDEVINRTIKDLQSLGYTETEAFNKLYTEGLNIYTTQDPVIQKICDDVYADESYFPEMGVSYWELNYALSIQNGDDEESLVHYHNNDFLEFYKDFDDPEHLYVDDGKSKFSLLFLDKEDMQAKIDAFKAAKLAEAGPDSIVAGETSTMTLQPQSSFVVMDQYTGEVAAIIGGRGVKEGNRTLNRATDSKRQPGSTFKILSTYLPALDSVGMTLASVQDDSGPYYYPGTTEEVTNWTKTKVYEGLTTVRRAILNSMNIVTVKNFAEVTPQLGYDYLQKLGFTTLVDSDITYSTALGGLTYGVTNLELTAAYAAIADGGIYTEPILYTKILDRNGKVILSKTPKKEQVMKESTAFLLTSAMEDVVKVGTGTSVKLSAIKMPVAGKTGSTSNYNDLWFSGYSPYYTATIWSGFDNNRLQTNTAYPKKIWKTIMEQIHIQKDLEIKEFTKPDSVISVKICTKSGKLAVEGLCDDVQGKDFTKVEYFAKGTEPIEKCDVHVTANICTDSGLLATDNCPADKVKTEVFLNKTEIAKTDDTPFILPKDYCNVHGSGTKAPSSGNSNNSNGSANSNGNSGNNSTDNNTNYTPNTNVFDDLIP